MSSGHRHHTHNLSTHELNEALSDKAVLDALKQPFEISTEFDIPFVAGYSNDGNTRYVDRHLKYQDHPVGTIMVGNKPVNVLPFLVGDKEAEDPIARGGHEGTEKAAEQLRTKQIKSEPTYDYRHEIATAAERRLVTKAGINWQKYQDAYKEYIKADQHEKIKKLPKDLDMTPYKQDGNKSLLKHMKEVMK